MKRNAWIVLLILSLEQVLTPIRQAVASPGGNDGLPPAIAPERTDLDRWSERWTSVQNPIYWSYLSYYVAAEFIKQLFRYRKEAADARKKLIEQQKANKGREKDLNAVVTEITKLNDELDATTDHIPELLDKLLKIMQDYKMQNVQTGTLESPFNQLADLPDLIAYLDSPLGKEVEKHHRQWKREFNRRLDALMQATQKARLLHNDIARRSNPYLAIKLAPIPSPENEKEDLRIAQDLPTYRRQSHAALEICQEELEAAAKTVQGGAHHVGRMAWVKFWLHPKNNWKMLGAAGATGAFTALGNILREKYNSGEMQKEMAIRNAAMQNPLTQYQVALNLDQKGKKAAEPFREIIQDALDLYTESLGSVLYNGASAHERKRVAASHKLKRTGSGDPEREAFITAVKAKIKDPEAVRIAFNKAAAFAGAENGQITLDSLLGMLQDSRTNTARREGDCTEFFKSFYERFFNTLFAKLVHRPSETIEAELVDYIQEYTLKRIAGEKDIAPASPLQAVPDQGAKPKPPSPAAPSANILPASPPTRPSVNLPNKEANKVSANVSGPLLSPRPTTDLAIAIGPATAVHAATAASSGTTAKALTPPQH